MPYIKAEQRTRAEAAPENVGELNFAITRIIIWFLYFKYHGEMSYQAINDVMGALECAKQEFYRRMAAPYEDKKIQENGDVYG